MKHSGRIVMFVLPGMALVACSDASSIEGRVSGPTGDTTRFADQRVQLIRNPDSVRIADSTLCAAYLSADSAVASRMSTADSTTRIDLLEEHGDLIDHFASDAGEVNVDFMVQLDTTDADGRFNFTNVPPGRYALATMIRVDGSVRWWWDEFSVSRGSRVNQDLTTSVPIRSWCEHRYRAGNPSVWGASGPP